MGIREDLRAITSSIEKLSKRLRRVEVLARLSDIDTANTFLELTDTPSVYAGHAGWAAFVNIAETALEFQPVGSACVAFVCGSPGWRATGGTPSRTLVHETAFQLSADGDDRGDYAIDLQQVHWVGYAGADVAAAYHSAILTNEENIIDVWCEYSVIAGPWNEISDNSPNCYILGGNNTCEIDNYAVVHLGHSHYSTATDYAVLGGYNHNTDDAFGAYTFGETNEIIENVNDWPAYNMNVGIFNTIEGDCWLNFQHGEKNTAYGLGTPGDKALWSFMHGYMNYLGNVSTNIALGQGVRSYRPTSDGFYDGRIVWSGDYPRRWPVPPNPPGSGYSVGSGYNQDSWFSQSELITAWAVAWTTSRFEFPIIVDSIWGFLIYIVGTELGCANSYMWKIEGVIENDGGNTTILASTVTNIYRDVVTKEWQVIADNVNDRLVLQFRDTAGADPNDCNIQISMFTMEAGFAV